MNPTLSIFVCWLFFSPVSYVVLRRFDRAGGNGKWTNMDRVRAILVSGLCGPVVLPFAGAFVLLEKLGKTDWARKDARW